MRTTKEKLTLVKSRRLALGLSQEALARECGDTIKSYITIARIERGENVMLDTAEIVLKTLDRLEAASD